MHSVHPLLVITGFFLIVAAGCFISDWFLSRPPTREYLLFRSKRWSVVLWNVWWWGHEDRGWACTTWYVGPLVFCRSNS